MRRRNPLLASSFVLVRLILLPRSFVFLPACFDGINSSNNISTQVSKWNFILQDITLTNIFRIRTVLLIPLVAAFILSVAITDNGIEKMTSYSIKSTSSSTTSPITIRVLAASTGVTYRITLHPAELT